MMYMGRISDESLSSCARVGLPSDLPPAHTLQRDLRASIQGCHRAAGALRNGGNVAQEAANGIPRTAHAVMNFLPLPHCFLS